MKLDVLPPQTPWYADGLDFTCTQCGNCCTGGPGFVWIDDEEVERLAVFLKITTRQVLARYCRKVGGRWSLKERRTPQGLYDCVFLTTREDHDSHGTRRSARELRPGDPVPLKPRGCAIYPVRPLQCRTWPFWDSNLSAEEAWKLAARRCPGMGRGGRHFTRERIEELRTAADWPADPPTSDGSAK